MSLDLSKYEGHTPGPWICTDRDSGDNIFTATDPQKRIANSFGNCTFSEYRANALLIADAPQLLAELREARAENERLRDGIQRIIDGAPTYRHSYPENSSDAVENERFDMAQNDGCCVALQRGCSVRGLSNDLASKPHNWDVIDFAVYDNAALILKLGPTLAVALDNGGNEREHDSI